MATNIDNSDRDQGADGSLTRRSLLVRGSLASAGLAGIGGLSGLAGLFPASSLAASSATKTGLLVVGDSDVANALDPDGPAAEYGPNLTVVENCYDSLVHYATEPNPASRGGGFLIDPSKPIPGLAESWTVSKDGTRWLFNLRKGVMSNLGNELTSADIVWTYERNSHNKATGAFIWAGVIKATSLRAVSKYSFEVVTDGPSPLMLPALATVAVVWPIDSTAAKKHATSSDPYASKWLTNNIAGFGPFALETWKTGQSETIVPRSTYWGKKPAHSFRVLAIAESSTRLATLQSGALDMALGLAATDIQSASSNPSLHVYSFNGNEQVILFINFDVPALANQQVRQALWYATPSAQIAKQVYFGRASVTGTFMPAYLPYGVPGDTYNPPNLTKAKQLLAQAGYSSGLSTTLYYGSDRPEMGPVAAILQAAFASIGVTITLNAQPSSQLVSQAFASKNLPLYLTDTASSVNPDGSGIGGIYETKGFANISNYHNPAFDTVAAKAGDSLNLKTRIPLFKQMQQQLTENPPAVPVVNYYFTVVTKKTVDNVPWFPSQAQHFNTITTT